jgi:hypothetical protein
VNLHSGAGMGEGPGVCCRQSRLRGTVGGLFVCAFVVGGAFLLRHRGAPRLMWIGWAVLAAVCVLLFLREVRARFRPTNWVLRVAPDGLWVNLRPLQPAPTNGAATSLHLSYAEIARVHRHIDTWSTPSTQGGSTRWKLESLDVHLASGDTRGLSPTLAEARAAGEGLPTSVAVPVPGLIRIAWRGHGHDVVPGLGPVLAEIGQRVAVAEPTRTDRPDWRQLSDAELDEQIEHLVRRGDPLEASGLLIRRRGCSATEAHKLVEMLSTRV